MTNASVGSQEPVTSREPMIFAGRVMPDSARPSANSAPKKEASGRGAGVRGEGQCRVPSRRVSCPRL